MAVDPYSAGAAAGGAVLNFLGGRSAMKAQKEVSRQQRDMLKRQGQLFEQTAPMYQQGVAGLARQAGIGVDPGFRRQEEALQRTAEREQIERWLQQQANMARHQMGGRQGLMESGTLARLSSDAGRTAAGFERDRGLRRRAEEMQALQALVGSTGMGLGMGGQAAAGFGQMAGQYGQQAGQAFGGIQDIIGNYMYMQQLQKQQPLPTGSFDSYGRAGAPGMTGSGRRQGVMSQDMYDEIARQRSRTY